MNKVKPKEIMVNLPVVLMFDDEDKIAEFASAINTIIHGKVKIKYEVVGYLSEQYVGLFYLQRNNESQELRDQFLQMIDMEEAREENKEKYIAKIPTKATEKVSLADKYDPDFGDDVPCICGHPYYRHFDTYENMEPVGCKYCYKHAGTYENGNCAGFKISEETKI